METKRNRLRRRHHARRVFKARLKVLSACMPERKEWFEIVDKKWVRPIKTTGKPCSCWMCKGEDFDRKAAKKEARRQVEEYYEENLG